MFRKFTPFLFRCCLLICLTACSLSYKVPELPDLDTKTLSYQEISQKKLELQKKIREYSRKYDIDGTERHNRKIEE